MPNQTGTEYRRRHKVVSTRLDASEFAQLKVLARMAGCRSEAEFLRQLVSHAADAAKRRLQEF